MKLSRIIQDQNQHYPRLFRIRVTFSQIFINPVEDDIITIEYELLVKFRFIFIKEAIRCFFLFQDFVLNCGWVGAIVYGIFDHSKHIIFYFFYTILLSVDECKLFFCKLFLVCMCFFASVQTFFCKLFWCACVFLQTWRKHRCLPAGSRGGRNKA